MDDGNLTERSIVKRATPKAMIKHTGKESHFYVLLAMVVVLYSCSSRNTVKVTTPNENTLILEVALNQEERRKGLMFRSSLEEGKGMIFVFKEVQVLSFWMKNTSIPLSIAFLDSNGRVVHTADMTPFSLDSVSSRYPSRYAIEVNQGELEKLGIKKESAIDIPPHLLKKVE